MELFRPAMVLASVLALTACSGTPAPAPTVTVTVTATPPAPSLSPSLSPSPTPTASDGDGLTGPEAALYCLSYHEGRDDALDHGTELTAPPQIYKRVVEPGWLVLYEAENEFGPMWVECRVAGTVEEPDRRGYAEMSDVTDQYIDDVVNKEDEGL